MARRLIILFVLIFGWNASAWANPELVIVGAHIAEESQADRSEALLRRALSSAYDFSVVGAEDAQARLRGVGPRLVSQALMERATVLLAEGRVLFEHADMEAARDRIAESVSAFEENLGVAVDNRGLVDALLVQGNIALAMGDPSTASKAFKRVVRIDPGRVLDAVSHPPKVIQLFTEVREQVLAVPAGSILVDTIEPGATVHLDGRFFGVGVGKLEDIPSGAHHLLVSAEGGQRWHALVEVRPGEQAVVRTDLKDFYVGPTAATESERELQVRNIYSTIGDHLTEGFVLIAGETGVDEVGLQLYEARTGIFSSVVRRPSDGDPLAGIIELVPQLGAFTEEHGGLRHTAVSKDGLGLDLNTNPHLARVLFAPSQEQASALPTSTAAVGATAEARESRRSKVPWYLWVGAGVVVAGATTTALILSSTPQDAKKESVSTGTGTAVVRF